MNQYNLSPNNPKVLDNLINHLVHLNPYKDWRVIIKRDEGPKTAQQRSYFHAILQEVENYTGDHIDDLKMNIKYRVLPLREIKLANETHLYPISTERATTKQYNELIQSALILAAMAGVSPPATSHFGYTWEVS